LYPDSTQLYEKLYKELENYEMKNKGNIVCIHGDTVFTNILINQYEKIKFIDMRGKQDNICTLYEDSLYDWAKLYQSLIGYDEILMDKEINKKYKSQMINHFKKIFLESYTEEDLANVKFITKSLLFTLIPLHNNDKCIQYYNLIQQI
jgi:hypothetical protein